MSQLTNNLILKGYLKTDLVIDAFSEIQRIEFIPEEYHRSSDADVPFPIGYGRSIPQPQIVSTILELLDIHRGDHILEVGSGSGWITALLAYMVGEDGYVVATDSSQELLDLARENVDKYQFIKRERVKLFHKEHKEGYKEAMPYDKILVNVVMEEVPQELKDQLRVGGTMIVPLYNDIWTLKKESEDEFSKEIYSGFSFIPLETKG